MAEKKSGDPYKGIWRWFWDREVRPHWLRVTAGSLVLPVITAVVYPISIFDSTASTSDRIWAGVAAAGIAFGVVVVLVTLVALIVAPYQQRDLLISEIESLKSAQLSASDARQKEPASEIHAETLKDVLIYVREHLYPNQILDYPTGMSPEIITGHFPELEAELSEWNAQVKLRMLLDDQLERQFKNELQRRGMDNPGWQHDVLRKYFESFKYRALIGKTGEPFALQWRPDEDTPNDGVMLWDGTEIALLGHGIPLEDREKCQRTFEKFLGDMDKWELLKVYGHPQVIGPFNECQSNLNANLVRRINQDGYLRGNGCPRCPQ